jgi:polysaccharide export outer membrane protein
LVASVVRRSIVAIFVASAAMLTTACGDTRGGSIPYRALPAPDEAHFDVLPQDYKIAPMDTLNIKVFQADNMSGDYPVDLAGHISLPLVGEVEAANLTTDQLDAKLTQLLGTKYYENPDVSVAIKDSSAHAVTVDGAVVQSGRYPVSSNLSLSQAIAIAKGTAPNANNRRIAVFRTINGQREAAAFDLTAIRHGEAKDPPIYPGDIVIVDGSNIKAAYAKIIQSVPLMYVFSRF